MKRYLDYYLPPTWFKNNHEINLHTVKDRYSLLIENATAGISSRFDSPCSQKKSGNFDVEIQFAK